jgi:hypothetical protein
MTNHVINIFSIPREFPCGPASGCCGPVGLSDEELQALKQGLETRVGLPVQTFNVRNVTVLQNNRQVLAVLRTFGLAALPIIAINDEVVSMGLPESVDQVVESIREKVNHLV